MCRAVPFRAICHPAENLGARRHATISAIDREIERFSPAPLTERSAAPPIADRALTIYTSGTTGLPKAANVSHRRLMQWSLWFAGLMNTGPDDRMYDCLPMYHSVGGVVATGAVLVRGGSVVLREKFSVREFWDDVADWDCTLFQYIGELCRYLVNAPEHPREREHRLRLAAATGCAPTSGRNSSRASAFRRFGILCRDRRQHFALQRRGQSRRHWPRAAVPDPSLPAGAGAIRRRAGAPARDAKGAPSAARPTKPARRSAASVTAADAGGAFEGYTSAADTERKILRDVFEAGDAWYRTGDLMRMDAAGFFYFVDRIGDTFRWKGENVATSEVAAALMAFPGIGEATVYGVAVPGTEGAAGMAAIVADAPLDFAQLRRHLAQRLPAYARPLFLRLMDRSTRRRRSSTTRIELAREGFDPAAVARPDLFRRSGTPGLCAARCRAL